MISWKRISFYSWAAVAILLFLAVNRCNKVQELRNNNDSVNAFLNDTIQYYQNELGQEVAEKIALQGDKQTLQTLLSKEIDKNGQLSSLAESFRKIDAAGLIRTETKFDTIEVPFEVPVETSFSRSFSKNEKFYSLSGSVDQLGVYIDSFNTETELAFAIGKRKTGLFQSEYRFEATSNNPHVKITGLDGYTYKENTGYLSIDAQAGYGITLNGPGPYAGIGLGFDLWLFFKSLFK